MSDHSNLVFLEIGNSRAHWRYHGSDYNCDTAVTNDVFARFLEDKLAVEKIVAVSVGKPELLDSLHDRHGSAINWSVLRAAPEKLMASDYVPDQLGLDRWLACYAVARFQPQGSHVVIDAGTAVTVDLVRDGRHEGGWILPGIGRWHETLLTGTNIPSWEPVYGRNEPGRSTAEAIANAWISAVFGVVGRAIEYAGRNQVTWLTGGDGPRLTSVLPAARSRPNLVLDGLAAWFSDTTETG